MFTISLSFFFFVSSSMFSRKLNRKSESCCSEHGRNAQIFIHNEIKMKLRTLGQSKALQRQAVLNVEQRHPGNSLLVGDLQMERSQPRLVQVDGMSAFISLTASELVNKPQTTQSSIYKNINMSPDTIQSLFIHFPDLLIVKDLATGNKSSSGKKKKKPAFLCL